MMNLQQEICNAFNAQAKHYDKASKVQNEIGQRLLERLDLLTMQPNRVLDLGCGTGTFTKLLKKKYPKARVVGVDIALEMLKHARHKQSILKKWPLINTSMDTLPFADQSFDLIFSNQVIHWSSPMQQVFKELYRILNIEGCLMFSTLGPDTFKELKQAWGQVDEYQHTNEFADMHDVGDYLLQEHFVDPVVDMEMLTVQYKTPTQLLKSLKAQGVKNINTARRKGLTPPSKMKAFIKYYEQNHADMNKIPLTYEVVYGHAWKGSTHISGKGVETFISIEDIKGVEKG